MPTAKAKKRSVITEAKRRMNLAKNGITKNDDSVYGALMRVGHDEDFEPMRLPELTDAPPGSLEKLTILAQRVIRGECLKHPEDNAILATVEQSAEMRSWAIQEALKYRGR